MDKAKAAYAAGIIDGEGSIGIARKTNRNGSYYYSLTVQVSMKNIPVPEWLATNCSGHVGRYKQSVRAFGGGYISKWAVHGHEAHGFLLSIQPYLIEKWEQAKFALMFPLGEQGNHYSLSDDGKEYQGMIYEIMKELNQHGP